ncbi:hypothetical protein G7046_g5423 [Stylonectria norvegica]|nr:hypothetical protein G7046_g5423 [Stylonectria norvegica]
MAAALQIAVSAVRHNSSALIRTANDHESRLSSPRQQQALIPQAAPPTSLCSCRPLQLEVPFTRMYEASRCTTNLPSSAASVTFRLARDAAPGFAPRTSHLAPGIWLTGWGSHVLPLLACDGAEQPR